MDTFHNQFQSGTNPSAALRKDSHGPKPIPRPSKKVQIGEARRSPIPPPGKVSRQVPKPSRQPEQVFSPAELESMAAQQSSYFSFKLDMNQPPQTAEARKVQKSRTNPDQTQSNQNQAQQQSDTLLQQLVQPHGPSQNQRHSNVQSHSQVHVPHATPASSPTSSSHPHPPSIQPNNRSYQDTLAQLERLRQLDAWQRYAQMGLRQTNQVPTPAHIPNQALYQNQVPQNLVPGARQPYPNHPLTQGFFSPGHGHEYGQLSQTHTLTQPQNHAPSQSPYPPQVRNSSTHQGYSSATPSSVPTQIGYSSTLTPSPGALAQHYPTKASVPQASYSRPSSYHQNEPSVPSPSHSSQFGVPAVPTSIPSTSANPHPQNSGTNHPTSNLPTPNPTHAQSILYDSQHSYRHNIAQGSADFKTYSPFPQCAQDQSVIANDTEGAVGVGSKVSFTSGEEEEGGVPTLSLDELDTLSLTVERVNKVESQSVGDNYTCAPTVPYAEAKDVESHPPTLPYNLAPQNKHQSAATDLMSRDHSHYSKRVENNSRGVSGGKAVSKQSERRKGRVPTSSAVDSPELFGLDFLADALITDFLASETAEHHAEHRLGEGSLWEGKGKIKDEMERFFGGLGSDIWDYSLFSALEPSLAFRPSYPSSSQSVDSANTGGPSTNEPGMSYKELDAFWQQCYNDIINLPPPEDSAKSNGKRPASSFELDSRKRAKH